MTAGSFLEPDSNHTQSWQAAPPWLTAVCLCLSVSGMSQGAQHLRPAPLRVAIAHSDQNELPLDRPDHCDHFNQLVKSKSIEILGILGCLSDSDPKRYFDEAAGTE